MQWQKRNAQKFLHARAELLLCFFDILIAHCRRQDSRNLSIYMNSNLQVMCRSLGNLSFVFFINFYFHKHTIQWIKQTLLWAISLPLGWKNNHLCGDEKLCCESVVCSRASNGWTHCYNFTWLNTNSAWLMSDAQCNGCVFEVSLACIGR